VLFVPVFVAVTSFDATSLEGYRLRRLLQEIGSEKENKTIIFVETKRKVDEITRNIRRDGFVVCSMIT
jgi:superfamily II DNA/RNA helicase